MSEKDNIHPVVRLLAKRMESHPEEFGPASGGRWAEWLDRLIPFVTEEERVMLRGPMIQDIHEEVMDELMNGPERRAQEKRERDLEMQRMIAQSQQRAAQQASQLYGQAALQSGQLGNASGYAYNSAPTALPGTYYDAVTDTYNTRGFTMTKAQIENNPGLIASVKKALGL